MAAGSTYTPIATTTLGSNQNTVTFSSISGSYTDLVLICQWIQSSTEDLILRLGNGSADAATNYSVTSLGGTGSAAASYRSTNASVMDLTPYANGTSTDYAATIISLMNYANTTTYKTAIARSNRASGGVDATVGLWRSTSAINIIQVRCGTGSATFNTGSTFTLYGIAAA